MGIAVWRVTIKPKMGHFGGMSVFAKKKMCDYQRSSEHVVTRWGSTGRLTVPYRCTIDVWTHMGPYGVPTGPPEARRDPTGPRRHRRTPLNRRLPGLGGPQLLLASAVAIVALVRDRNAWAYPNTRVAPAGVANAWAHPNMGQEPQQQASMTPA